MINKITIYHNPRCSKSRKTLEIIKSKNIEPKIILYLENKLSKAEVKDLLSKLRLSIRDILRTEEDEYKKNNLKKKNLSDDELIGFLIKFPKLLQRPIVVKNSKAVIGRPPENILNLL
jgi:arsenate reductase